jgi:hypothetical protein
VATLSLVGCAHPQARVDQHGETRYLAFQIFSSGPDPRIPIGDSGLNPLGPMPSQDALDPFVQDIIHRIGTVGTGKSRLAVILGHLAFDNSDAEIRRFIAAGFSIAVKHNIAVGFHIDDSMFWARRTDLLSNPDNVEWMDWNGTPSTGRRIDWGPQPKTIPPQMCFNSTAIRAEVRRRAVEVIGKAIKTGVDQLRKQGKEDLFAGVIVGSETMIGQDFETNRYLGYHALVNRGFSESHPPKDMDAEREKIVQEFITFWCKGIADAGVSTQKIYSHTAFLPHKLFEGGSAQSVTYSEHNHFAPPSVAFGEYHRPGFSTYPQPGLYDQIYIELAQHGHPAWASCEGTNLQLGSGPGQSGMNMETYLAKMFNHGAMLVNIFSWGLGGEAHKNMDFRVMTEGPEALGAYRKFLRGDRLIEAATGTSILERLPPKIHRIQNELPAWVQKTGDQADVEPLMQKLSAAMKSNDLVEAEKIADEVLKLIDSK